MDLRFTKSDMRTEITFGLIGETLCIQDIANATGLNPTRSFEKGDLYAGRQRISGRLVEVERRRPRGVWQLSTRAILDSCDIADHAIALLEKLEPVAGAFSEVKKAVGLFSRISICHVGSGSFEISSDLMQRLAALCDEVSIICWEVDETHFPAATMDVAEGER